MDLASTIRRRELCAERFRGSDESLGATASRADHWILVEYGGPWAKDPVAGSLLSARVKDHLHRAAKALPRGVPIAPPVKAPKRLVKLKGWV